MTLTRLTLPPWDWRWVLLWSLVSLALSVGGVAAVGALLVRLPATYFSSPSSHGFWTNAHPILRWTGLTIKNIVGAALIVLGIVLAMPGVPGPGVLVILSGIIVMDFPGKRRLEWWLIRRPTVHAAVNRLRQRYGRPPFVL